MQLYDPLRMYWNEKISEEASHCSEAVKGGMNTAPEYLKRVRAIARTVDESGWAEGVEFAMLAELRILEAMKDKLNWEAKCFEMIRRFPFGEAFPYLTCYSIEDGEHGRIHSALDVMEQAIAGHNFYVPVGRFMLLNLKARFCMYRGDHDGALTLLTEMGMLPDCPCAAIDIPFQLWERGFRAEVRSYFSHLSGISRLYTFSEEEVSHLTGMNRALSLRGDRPEALVGMLEECLPGSRLAKDQSKALSLDHSQLQREMSEIDGLLGLSPVSSAPPVSSRNHWLCYDRCWLSWRD